MCSLVEMNFRYSVINAIGQVTEGLQKRLLSKISLMQLYAMQSICEEK